MEKRELVSEVENLNNELQAILNPPDKYKKEKKINSPYVMGVPNKWMYAEDYYKYILELD